MSDDRNRGADMQEDEPDTAEETEQTGKYEQSGGLGTGTQGDSIARELADRED